MHMINQIFIANMCGSDSNKGDLAILENTVYLVKQTYPEIRIILQDVDYSIRDIATLGLNRWTKELVDEYYGSFFPGIYKNKKSRFRALISGLANLWSSFRLLLNAKLVQLTGRNLRWGISTKKQAVWQQLLQSELVIVKGGSYLYGFYGRVKDFLFLFRMLLTPWLAVLLGKRVVFLGHSIGPITGRFHRYLVKLVLNQVEFIGCRERLSLDYIRTELKLSGPRIDLIPDIAFINQYPQDNPKRVNELLSKEGVHHSAESPVVGLTVRNWDFPTLPNLQSHLKAYQDAISEIIKFLQQEFKATILFIPHYIGDIPFAQHIYNQLQDKANVYILRGDYPVAELRAISHALILLIGTRIHSNILALSVGTPVIPLAYQIHKGYGIMEFAGIDQSDIFNIAQIDINKLKQRVAQLMNPIINAEYRDRIGLRVTAMQQEIIDKVKQYLI